MKEIYKIESKDAGTNPEVEITIRGGRNNAVLFEAIVSEIRKLRRRQRVIGSEVLDYRVILVE